MIERFLRYSLERESKICIVLIQDGIMKKTNLRVTDIDDDGAGFDALLPGRKRIVHINMNDVLTAAYARGDKGELE